MFGLLGGLLGAGGSIASALIGADAGDQAAAYNYATNMYNARKQNEQRQQQLDFAKGLVHDQQLGGTDALGNKSHFVPGQGWVTELSPEQQQLYDYFFKQELPERRDQFGRQAERSRQEGDVANQLLDQFTRVQRTSPNDLENELYANATRGANDALGKQTETAMRQSLRTGGGHLDDIMQGLAKASMSQRADARSDARLRAQQIGDTQYNNERGNISNLYNMFAQRAGNPLGASFDPTGIPQDANSLMRFFTQASQQGNSAEANALATPFGKLDYVSPNYSYANAAGAIGQSLAGFGDNMQSQQDKSNMNNLLMQYITHGGQIDMGNGGFFGSMTDRLAGSGGRVF